MILWSNPLVKRSENEGSLQKWELLPIWGELALWVYEISSPGSGASIRVSNESQAHPDLIKSLAGSNGHLVSLLSAEKQQTAVKKHSKLSHSQVIHTIYPCWQMLVPFCLFLEARFILSKNKSWASLSWQPKDEEFEFHFPLLCSLTRTHSCMSRTTESQPHLQ